MNATTRLLIGSLLYLNACAALHAYDHPTPPPDDPYDFAIRDHANFLNELSNRRRLNTLFPNEQSVFYGVPIRYVNSSRGNLTFLRRDLVTIGRIPIVVGRVYDSTNRSDTGFGPGWRLSLAETIATQPDDTLIYVDDSGSAIPLVRRGSGFAVRDPGPSDIASIDIGDDHARIVLRNGWRKAFRRIGRQLALTDVRDAYGNTLTIRYQGSRPTRIETQDGRFVLVQWSAAGQIVRVTDDQNRAVSYFYNERGLLRTVADIGANEWQYDYDESKRLSAAADPQGISILSVASDSSNRAVFVAILGEQYRYRYEQERTTIRDQANRTTSVVHNRYGIATSITGPTGFMSEVRLDEANRVTSLIHNSALRASINYGSQGQPDTLIRYSSSAQVRYVYTYDALSRLTSVIGSDGSALSLTYNAAGDLQRKQEGSHWIEYEYTTEGDLRSITKNDGAFHYAHNSHGQLLSIANAGSITGFGYYPNGKLQSISFPDGSLHNFGYNVIGLRKSVDRNDFDIEYQYDAAGNLNRSIGFDASGRQVGQTFELDNAYRARVVRHDAGDITKATYDRSGNPETLANSEDPAMPFYSYTYDENNRLLAVADGDTTIGSYVYSGTEPDLRDQLDDRTGRTAANTVRQSATFGNLHSIAYTRPHGTFWQIVWFNEATSSFDLPQDNGVVLSDAVRLDALARQKISNSYDGVQSRIDFDRPSNVTFLPPEYATINCAQGCVFNGIIVKANGVQGSITVPFGSTVNFTAHKVGVNSCDLLICSWYKNGAFAGFGTPSTWQHTFSSSGAFSMLGACECSPCDFFDYQSVTVNVSSCATGIVLNTLTEATMPSDRSRTTVGVGEVVTLTLNPTPQCAVTWSKSGTNNGTISGTTGSSITFTAHERASTATVTANVGGTNRSVTFTVIEPNTVFIEKAFGWGIFHTQFTPSVGFKGQLYVGPTNVSFKNVQIREDAVPGFGTGYFAYQTGDMHEPQVVPAPLEDVVVPGKGTRVIPLDEVQAGSDNHLPYTDGSFTWEIPWRFRVGSGVLSPPFWNSTHLKSIDATGKMTLTKGGVTVSAELNDPDSDY
jgi:YD repeat-containing protein